MHTELIFSHTIGRRLILETGLCFYWTRLRYKWRHLWANSRNSKGTYSALNCASKSSFDIYKIHHSFNKILGFRCIFFVNKYLYKCSVFCHLSLERTTRLALEIKHTSQILTCSGILETLEGDYCTIYSSKIKKRRYI